MLRVCINHLRLILCTTPYTIPVQVPSTIPHTIEIAHFNPSENKFCCCAGPSGYARATHFTRCPVATIRTAIRVFCYSTITAASTPETKFGAARAYTSLFKLSTTHDGHRSAEQHSRYRVQHWSCCICGSPPWPPVCVARSHGDRHYQMQSKPFTMTHRGAVPALVSPHLQIRSPQHTRRRPR